tara:strand:- start:576 stop:926 length:351 start_codon:yes stop_codon:yes gene_type:complete
VTLAYKITEELPKLHTRTLLPQEKRGIQFLLYDAIGAQRSAQKRQYISTLRTNVMTPKCCVDHLSKLMVEAAAFFHKHELHCWLDWDPLLGAVREGKLVDWDRDGDFGFHAHGTTG